ncbi:MULTISPECIES: MFS transporter [Streptomyces]|nr:MULTISPECIES: MFS transporter [Streptomyces]MCX4393221.1 MFS transporter [Streptomyces sp. NBC_01767]MCX4849025.1 MFS transporter [Streptomyces sp. NBC_00893]
MVRIVTITSIAFGLTAPGQTTAVSAFVDPLIQDLGVSRSAVSTAYLIGSVSGAFVMPFLGRLIDRFGPRALMAGVALCFGGVLIASSLIAGVPSLTMAFIGMRVGGQGALSLVATTAVAIYIERRRGLAMGLTSAVGTAIISLTPLALERMIQYQGWRTALVLEGLAVLLLVVPAALFLPPRPQSGTNSSEAEGAAPAGEEVEAKADEAELTDLTLRQALHTGVFWVVALGVGVCSLIGTGLNFQQVSLLGERGLSATEAAATFLPQMVAGLAATLALGWLADRVSDRFLIISVMLILAALTAGAGWVQPGISVLGYSLALGAVGHGVRTLEAVVFPRCFGVRHLGAIRGVVHSVTVGASAFGPLALAYGRGLASSYRPVLLVLTVFPLAVALATVFVRTPRIADET